ncbi:DUF5999 family protein [Streptomyces rochei]|uniref:DUF5999 family protein n=2 Tax=Streptomyces rochei group TaxID=2867164 RepID=A0ABW7E2P6_STRRO|nr:MULTISPECIES: DUF5999 family protein [Streptomyces]MDV6287974.1 DUF5999 family protein [Streptomyces sp. UP1A-1]KYK14859.1 hypothetical protein AUW26_24930 [Streptomyces sp. CC71]MBQ0913179.1 hypothetical protein [Streptomyces sp. RM99]MBU8552435.1 hypothetical protein [Streptomyces sp. Osf17]MBU8559224.1 hypothetical protein [Streptomyces sp. Babs14]
MCTHRSSCPAAGSPAERPASAHVVAARPEQGWSLLCDGTIVFDDTGELLPDGRVVAPCRAWAGTGAEAGYLAAA